MPFKRFQCKWTHLKCRGTIPCPRSDHAAVVAERLMYVFGGRNERGEYLGDLLALAIDSKVWYKFDHEWLTPSPRSGLCMSSHGSKIYVFGGEADNVLKDERDMSFIYTVDTTKLRSPDVGGPFQWD